MWKYLSPSKKHVPCCIKESDAENISENYSSQ